ncbi:hypothetical protein AAF712_014284 [Marasmius tenuissimus]|uniref:Uncharacterized protein n=1 Tax=Marasmius tenuissimus TaxID=585030 RepID=A0ABR2ZCM0_9AGAR
MATATGWVYFTYFFFKKCLKRDASKIHLVAVKSAGGHLDTLLDTDFRAVASNAANETSGIV